MNAKNLKFLQLFESFVNIDYLTDKKLVAQNIKDFLDLDYQMAVDVWDYLASTRESKMAEDLRFAELIGTELFAIFYDRAPTKCVKAIGEIPTVRRAVFQYSSKACLNASFDILVELLAGGKSDKAEEIFKCLIKNEKIEYGDTLKRTLEQLFIELLKKNPAKIEMSKKLSSLLLTYVRKIKTDEKAMLEQRIKETL